MTLGSKLRLLHAHMSVCITKIVPNTYNIISNQVMEMKMTMPIGFVNLCTAVTTDDNVSSKMTKAKMTMHVGSS